MRIDIEIKCVPPTATAQQKGVFVAGGRVRFFKKKRVKEAEDFLAAMLAPYAPRKPLEGAIRLSVEWTYPYRKSERKAVLRRAMDIRHTTRPDLDNLEKNLIDTMTRLAFWTDDAQVCEKHTAKFRGAEPSIRIKVEAVR